LVKSSIGSASYVEDEEGGKADVDGFSDQDMSYRTTSGAPSKT
jgi:hypothetical protein